MLFFFFWLTVYLKPSVLISWSVTGSLSAKLSQQTALFSFVSKPKETFMGNKLSPSPCTESQHNGDLETFHLSPGTKMLSQTANKGLKTGSLEQKLPLPQSTQLLTQAFCLWTWPLHRECYPSVSLRIGLADLVFSCNSIIEVQFILLQNIMPPFVSRFTNLVLPNLKICICEVCIAPALLETEQWSDPGIKSVRWRRSSTEGIS